MPSAPTSAAPRPRPWCWTLQAPSAGLDGQPLAADLAARLGQAVGIANDGQLPGLVRGHRRRRPWCARGQVSLARWHNRLARPPAGVINLLDPDVIVLGGGLSRIADTYRRTPAQWGRWVFSGDLSEPVCTRLLPALHGGASGVRGAAWLGRTPDLNA